jgi:hypothetical protein
MQFDTSKLPTERRKRTPGVCVVCIRRIRYDPRAAMVHSAQLQYQYWYLGTGILGYQVWHYRVMSHTRTHDRRGAMYRRAPAVVLGQRHLLRRRRGGVRDGRRDVPGDGATGATAGRSVEAAPGRYASQRCCDNSSRLTYEVVSI